MREFLSASNNLSFASTGRKKIYNNSAATSIARALAGLIDAVVTLGSL